MAESSEKLTVKLEVDTANAEKELKEFQKKAEKDKLLKLQIDSAKLKEELRQANAEVRKFNKQGNKDAALVARLKADKLRGDVNAVNAEIRKVKKGFFGLNTIINDAIKAFLGFTVVRQIGGFFLNAVTGAAKFEETMANVSTLIQGDSTEAIKQFRAQIIALSKEVPKTVDDLGGGLYQVLSAGITNASDAMQVLEVSSKAAVAGITDTNTAVDAITTVLNAWNLEASQASAVSDVFFTTIREGKTTFPELASAIGTVASSAALAQISFEEVGASLATMTKAGISTDEAVTALNRLFLSIANPTDGLKKKTKELGVEFSAAALRAKGFGAFMDEVTTAFEGNDDAIFALGLDMRAFKALSVLAGTGAEEFAVQLENMSSSMGAADEAFNKMNETAKNQYQLFKNELTAAMLTFADTVMPSLTNAMNDSRDSVGGLTKFLNILGAVFTSVFEFIRSGFDTLSTTFAIFAMRTEATIKDFPDLLKVVWNTFISAIETGINYITDRINSLLQFTSDAINKISLGLSDVNIQIGKVSLSGVKFDSKDLFKGTKEATRTAGIAIQGLAERSTKGFNRIKDAWKSVNKTISGNGATGDAVQRAKDLQEALNKISKTGGTSGGGGGGKTNIDEFQKKVDETFKDIEKIRESDRKQLDKTKKYWEKTIDGIEKDLSDLEETHAQASKNIQDDIKNTQKSLDDLTNEYNKVERSAEDAFAGDVATRVIELKEEYKKLKEEIKLANEEGRGQDIPELVKRQQEVQQLLREGTALTSQEDIAEAQRVAGLSEFELLKEQFDKEKELRLQKFEEEKAELEAKKLRFEEELAAEDSKFEASRELLKDNLERAENLQAISEQKALERTQRTTDKLVAYWNAVKQAKEEAIGITKAEIAQSIGLLQTEGGIAGSNVTNTQNVKINQNISSEIDVEAANRELLRKTQPI